jgi:zinc transport system permease protein
LAGGADTKHKDFVPFGDGDILALIALFVIFMAFQAWGYNRMLYVGLNPVLAKAHRVPGQRLPG